MLNFCTLFDINFISQGLLMYESLKEHCKNFHLYIFAFCDESYKFLNDLKLENATIVSLKDFEDEELLKIKPARTKGEYCWTCASSTILYCIEKFNLESCTYIDADMYFYSDPKILLDEMGDKSVQIVEHRYAPKYDQTATSGKYCVQFNTFKNNENGLKVLNWWRNKCLEWCFARFEDNKFGDQKYLDDWLERFDCVYSLENLGGGLAPWNSINYTIKKEKDKYFVSDDKRCDELVFYHFHNLKFLDSGEYKRKSFKFYEINKKAKNLYSDYLKKLSKLSKKLHKINKNVKILKNECNPRFTWDIKTIGKSIIQKGFKKNCL